MRLDPVRPHLEPFTAAAYAAADGLPLHFLGDDEDQVGGGARDEAICGRLRALLGGVLDGAGDLPGASAPDAGGTRRGGRNGRAGPERLAVVCALTHLYVSEARLTIYSQQYEAIARRYVVDGKGAVRDQPIVLPWAPSPT